MANCLLSWKNWIDLSETAITPSSEASGLGVNRLKDPQLRKRWRSAAGDVGPYFTADFGQALEVGVLALFQPNDAGYLDANRNAVGAMISTDDVTHRLSAVSAGGSELLNVDQDGGWRDGYNCSAYVLPNAVNAHYWTSVISAHSLVTTPGYVDIGRAWAGPAWRPTRSLAFGMSWAFADGSIVGNVPTSGLDYVRRQPKRRVISFGFDSLTEAEADQITELSRLVGTSEQVLMIPDPSDTTYEKSQPIIGRLTEASPVSLPNYAQYAKAFSIIQSV